MYSNLSFRIVTDQRFTPDIMTTQTVVSLEDLLGALGAKTPIPPYPAADVLLRPLDIGRSYLADLLSNVVGCDGANAFDSIQYPNSIDNGDLAVILPRLNHSSEADTLGTTIMQKV